MINAQRKIEVHSSLNKRSTALPGYAAYVSTKDRIITKDYVYKVFYENILLNHEQVNGFRKKCSLSSVIEILF